jgi:hypothetical protein
MPDIKDNLNDEFIPYFIHGYYLELYEFYVFDGWGRLIFQTELQDKPRNVTYWGERCKVDTYIWKVKCKKYNEADIAEKFGHVTIVKYTKRFLSI